MLSAFLVGMALAPGAMWVEPSQSAPASKQRQTTSWEDYVEAGRRLRNHSNLKPFRDLKNNSSGTPLSRAKAVAKAYPEVLALVVRGNKKPFVPLPPNVDPWASVTQGAELGDVPFVIAAQATAKLAERDTKAAADALIMGLEFTNRIGRGDITDVLRAGSRQAILLSAVDGATLQFKPGDSQRVADYVAGLLRRKPVMSDGFRISGELTARLFVNGLEPGEPAPDFDVFVMAEGQDERTVARFEREYNRLSDSGKRDAIRKAAAHARAHGLALAKHLEKAEARWNDSAPRLVIADLPTFIAGNGALDPQQTIGVEQKFRARLRLLRLHMLISAFHAKSKRLPKTLAELKAPEAVNDPLGGQFGYQLLDAKRYRLFSKGTRVTGEIEMVQRRRPSQREP